ncbi:MAG: sialate O-acetylesterase [Myxococcota bacterium]|nr:sialate O-acetylesterase [Myxococcota bacterium]
MGDLRRLMHDIVVLRTCSFGTLVLVSAIGCGTASSGQQGIPDGGTQADGRAANPVDAGADDAAFSGDDGAPSIAAPEGPADAANSVPATDAAQTADGVATDGALLEGGIGNPDGTASDAGNDPLAVEVYLLAGQSNATGQGQVSQFPTGVTPDQRVLLYTSLPMPGAINSGAPGETWIPLRPASEDPSRFGPEIGFGNEIEQLYPNRRNAIIKHARSSTNLYNQWAPGPSATDRTGWGPEFIIFVDTATKGLAALKGMGLRPIVRAMLWQQGENDALPGAPAAQYGANLAAFIHRVREQFSAPGMLFIYGYVLPPPPVYSVAEPGRDLVRQGETDVDQNSMSPLAIQGAFVIPTDDLSQVVNHIHFGTSGQLTLGKRFADKVHEVLGPL